MGSITLQIVKQDMRGDRRWLIERTRTWAKFPRTRFEDTVFAGQREWALEYADVAIIEAKPMVEVRCFVVTVYGLESEGRESLTLTECTSTSFNSDQLQVRKLPRQAM